MIKGEGLSLMDRLGEAMSLHACNWGQSASVYILHRSKTPPISEVPQGLPSERDSREFRVGDTSFTDKTGV